MPHLSLLNDPVFIFVMMFVLWSGLIINSNNKMLTELVTIFNLEYKSELNHCNKVKFLSPIGIILLLYIGRVMGGAPEGVLKADVTLLYIIVIFFSYFSQPTRYKYIAAKALLKCKEEGTLNYNTFNNVFNTYSYLSVSIAFFILVAVYMVIINCVDFIVAYAIIIPSIIDVYVSKRYFNKLIFQQPVPNWVKVVYGG